MPLYDYKCEQHGLFHELIGVSEEAATYPCPTCNEQAPRVILLSPQILDMDTPTRHAHSVNEKSAHEPITSSVSSRDHKHGSGCGCEKPNKIGGKAVFLADGSKIFPSSRPWMISH